MKISYLTILLFAVSSLTGCTTPPPPDPQKKLSTAWLTLPYEGPDQVEHIKSGDWVMKQYLSTVSTAQILEPITYEQKEIVSGTQLFQVSKGNTGRIYCTMEPVKTPSEFQKTILQSKLQTRHLCFEDTKNSGIFDQSYLALSLFDDLPTLTVITKDLGKTSVPYRILAKNEVEPKYFVGIKYYGKALLGTAKNFRFHFGDSEDLDRNENFQQIESEDYPQSINIQGATITITGEDTTGLTFNVSPISPGASFSARTYMVPTTTYIPIIMYR